VSKKISEGSASRMLRPAEEADVPSEKSSGGTPAKEGAEGEEKPRPKRGGTKDEEAEEEDDEWTGEGIAKDGRTDGGGGRGERERDRWKGRKKNPNRPRKKVRKGTTIKDRGTFGG
jgi:hypothetical protein